MVISDLFICMADPPPGKPTRTNHLQCKSIFANFVCVDLFRFNRVAGGGGGTKPAQLRLQNRKLATASPAAARWGISELYKYIIARLACYISMLVPVHFFLGKLQRSVNLVRNWPTILIFRIKNHTFSKISPQKPPYPRISGSEGCCPLKVPPKGAQSHARRFLDPKSQFSVRASRVQGTRSPKNMLTKT